jgi:hypothetical protein
VADLWSLISGLVQAAQPLPQGQPYPRGPGVAVLPGLYDPQADFRARADEAAQAGIPGPISPYPADLWAWRLQAAPTLERLILEQANPEEWRRRRRGPLEGL